MPASSPDRGGSPSRRCDRARPVRGPRTPAAHRTLPVKAFPRLRPPLPKGYGTSLPVRTPHDPRDVHPRGGRRGYERGRGLAFWKPDVVQLIVNARPTSDRTTTAPTGQRTSAT